MGKRGWILAVTWLIAACVLASDVGAFPTSRTVTWARPSQALAPTGTLTVAPASALDPALVGEQVYLYPQPLVRGDRVTLDVLPRLPQPEIEAVKVRLDLPSGHTVTAPVQPQGFDRVARARFYWVWDTTGLSGVQTITLTLELPPAVEDLDPHNNTLRLSLILHPEERLGPPEPQARWAFTRTSAFRLHYLTGSASARDLSEVLVAAEEAHADVRAQLSLSSTSPTDIYVLDRVVGQGGYAASDWVAISYVDRAYAPTRLDLLLRHELVHRYDRVLGCVEAPTLLREGLAVMVAGGHYRPTSLPRRAALLLDTPRYVPLARLAEDFYRHQHEVGYLEAGALVVYVYEALGWEGVETLCRAATEAEGSAAARLSTAFHALGWGTLATVEQRWLRWLGALHPTALEARALEAEIRYLEAMRAYQVRYDRVANFRVGVLFDPAVAETHGIVADFARSPDTPEAIALELLLQRVKETLYRHQPERATALLQAVEEALERPPPWEGAPQEVLSIVKATLSRGYEPYRVIEKPEQRGWFVYALDRRAWPTQRLLWAAQDEAGRWIVTGPQGGGER
ncbi:MAG: hypothetical protein ACP5HM_15125 [Anaerolineae bacterium]